MAQTIPESGLEIIHVKPGETVDLEGLSYDQAQIEIVGADIIIINPETGGKVVLPGLGLILFDEEQAPVITLNGQNITAQMFSAKLGTVANVSESEYISFTSLDVTDEAPEEQKELSDENKNEVIEELKQENAVLTQQIQEITEIQEDTELMLASLSLENAELQASKSDETEEKQERPTPKVEEPPPLEENTFTSNDDAASSSTSSASAQEEEPTSSETSSVSIFSFKSFLLQSESVQGTEDVMGIPTFVARGGGGSADATFNPNNTIQLQSEVLDLSARTDDIVVYADNPDLFDDTHMSRAIEISPSFPDGFEFTSASISGLPVGYELVGAVFAGGVYTIDLTGTALNERGDIQINLKYPVPSFDTFTMQISVTATFDPASGVSPAPSQTVQTFILEQKVEVRDVTGPGDLNFTDGNGDLVWVLANAPNDNTILSGTGNDTLNGSGGVDVIQAGDGDDIILANAGDDTIDGGDGNDTITGGLGNDTITGGAGTADLVDYTGRTEDIVLDMGVVNGSGFATATVGVSGETDLIRQVENITGGDGNDTITGDANDNILIGGLGDDVLDGGTGDDTIDGGDGTDSVSFISGGSGLTVNLGTGSVINVGTGNKTLLNIENIIATNFDDEITATGGDNTISGADGDDIFITDGDGNDVFDGGFGGVDTGLNDRIDYSTSLNGITVDLSGALNGNGRYDVTVGATTDEIIGIEDIYGSNTAADNITGGAADQEIHGGGGNDTIDGGGGNDEIYGGIGDDTLAGGAGSDTLYFSDLATAVTLNLTTSASGTATSGGNTDNFSTFEAYVLTGQDDTINSSSEADTVTGGGGNDTFYASAGADTFDGGAGTADVIDYTTRGAGIYIEADLSAAPNLTVDVRNSGDNSLIEQDIINNIENIIGSAGNDTFINGSDNNVIDGAGGSDTLSYQNDATGISFDMRLISGGFFDITIGAETDSVSSIENIIGSTAGDSMAGDTAANNFDGGNGNDTFIASEGGDTYTGGGGTDFVNYSTLAGLNSVIVDLAAGTATLDLGPVGAAGNSTDTYTDNIENVSGTSGDDTLTGNALDNTIFDLGGDDVLDGAGGTNTISYSLLSGQSVTVNLGAGTADDDGGAGALDTLTNFQNITGSSLGDTLIGDGGVNTINGNNGADTISGLGGNDILNGDGGDDDIQGGAGDDTIDGGSGNDRAVYTGGSAVTVNLSTGTATDGSGNTDTLISIEEVTGSSAGDTIIAGATTVEIDAEGGNDTITSNLQSTLNNIDGGANDDTILYTGVAGISGGSITGTVGNISLAGKTDIVVNVERFRMGNAGDSFTIDTSAIAVNLNEFDGNGGNDSIAVTTGGAGDLTGADIDGDTLATVFSDIEEFDFRGTDLTDTFDISDAEVTAITGGGNSLDIIIDGTNITLGDFNFLIGGGITNIDANPDPDIQHVIWSSGAELIVTVSP